MITSGSFLWWPWKKTVRPPRVADFGSDTLTRLQLDRSSLEKQKAEYSNESDLVDDALKDVENSGMPLISLEQHTNQIL